MRKDLLLVVILIGIFVSCGCISSQQPTITETITTTVPTTATLPATLSVIPTQTDTMPTESHEQASYNEGMMFYNQKKYQEAIEAYSRLILENKTNGKTYLDRGRAYYQIGLIKRYEFNGEPEFNLAISDFNTAEQYGLSPVDKVEMAKLRGYSNYWIGAEQSCKHDFIGKYGFPYFEKAATNFTMVLEINPDDVDALIGRSLSYNSLGAGTREIKYPYDQNKVDLSGKDALRANELDPHNAWSHLALEAHIITAEKGNIEAAVKQMDEAIKDNPDEAMFYWERGFLRMQTNDYDGAKSDLLKAKELQPRFAVVYYMLRDVDGSHNADIQIAMAYGQKALEINPNIAMWWLGFGYDRLFLNIPVEVTDREEALSCFDRAIEIDPECFGCHYGRWKILIWLNRIPEAKEEIRICRAIEGVDRDNIKYMEEVTDTPEYYGNYLATPEGRGLFQPK